MRNFMRGDAIMAHQGGWSLNAAAFRHVQLTCQTSVQNYLYLLNICMFETALLVTMNGVNKESYCCAKKYTRKCTIHMQERNMLNMAPRTEANYVIIVGIHGHKISNNSKYTDTYVNNSSCIHSH